MTGPEHYEAAQRELAQVHEESDGTWALARAQAATAHATLAQTAATIAASINATMRTPEGWEDVLNGDDN